MAKVMSLLYHGYARKLHFSIDEVSLLFSYLQQPNKVILGLGWDDVRKTRRGGQRGYEGLSIKRAPRRQPSFEFAGRHMLERIANFMRINPPPLPPIKVILFFLA